MVLHICLKAGTVRSQPRWAGDVQPSFLLTGLSEPLTLLPKLRLHSASQPQIWLQQSFQRTISDKREVRRGWRGGVSPWFSSTIGAEAREDLSRNSQYVGPSCTTVRSPLNALLPFRAPCCSLLRWSSIEDIPFMH